MIGGYTKLAGLYEAVRKAHFERHDSPVTVLRPLWNTTLSILSMRTFLDREVLARHLLHSRLPLLDSFRAAKDLFPVV